MTKRSTKKPSKIQPSSPHHSAPLYTRTTTNDQYQTSHALRPPDVTSSFALASAGGPLVMTSTAKIQTTHVVRLNQHYHLLLTDFLLASQWSSSPGTVDAHVSLSSPSAPACSSDTSTISCLTAAARPSKPPPSRPGNDLVRMSST